MGSTWNVVAPGCLQKRANFCTCGTPQWVSQQEHQMIRWLTFKPKTGENVLIALKDTAVVQSKLSLIFLMYNI